MITDRLPAPDRNALQVLHGALAALEGRLDWSAVQAAARPWVQAARADEAPAWALERLLGEFPISRPEGLALMRLAEALLRVPDAQTAIALAADQLGSASFAGAHASRLGALSAGAISLSRTLLGTGIEPPRGLARRIGARAVLAATLRAIGLLGRQFVLGEQIEDAIGAASAQRREQRAIVFSFDMLGEGARTEADAQRYLGAYRQAIDAIAASRAPDGISVKLSALHPRFEPLQCERMLDILLARAWTLCDAAASAGLVLTIDAEESARLELSLEVFEALAARVAATHPQWQGFGIAIQAYQTRALDTVAHVVALARRLGLRLACRLVKGAYWDGEIKRAQQLGLNAYPVFTRKAHTDISYLACAQAMLAAPDAIAPQFATHNAATIAALLQLGTASGTAFELQRLHGMGEAVHREVAAGGGPRCRIYAPVGRHRDLLAYLVRRLLENGANASFVHQLADPRIDPQQLLASPLELARAEAPPDAALPALPAPRELYGAARANSRGCDFSVAADRDAMQAAIARCAPVSVSPLGPDALEAAIARASAARRGWADRAAAERCAIMRAAADQLEARAEDFRALLVHEARKTWADAMAEVRETIDFLHYYAHEAERVLAPCALPGPTGESNLLRLAPRGIWACISPWNFPLAIFTGQISAALLTGNLVLAKPAEQTPACAQAIVDLLHRCGVPVDALQLLPGPGETLGAALVAHPAIAGVAFTGSEAVARAIARSLAARDGPLVPLIAETGGVNAMLVDSTALPEQVVDAVIASAFRSAGQRCSALRLLCVHEAIAEPLLGMLAGAVRELVLGPASDPMTDVGPLIDADAFAAVAAQCERLAASARELWVPDEREDPAGALMAPRAFEIADVALARDEIFGPVLQVVRWRGPIEALLERIDALGYGLTLGLQSRIDARVRSVAARARVGNLYVNRDMIGAVVGVQPFGGEGRSGTGPKAGGPHYLPRFCTERMLTIDTTAAGGNAALLAPGDPS